MNVGGNPLTSALGFWMMIQLVSTLTLLLGGLYALLCLSRAASGLNRLASAVEDLVARGASTSIANLPGPMPLGTTPFAPVPQNTPPSSSMPSSSAAPHSGEMPFSTPPISAPSTSVQATPATPAWNPPVAPPAMGTPNAERNDER